MTKTSPFAAILKPPYYAVIFSSQRTQSDNGYEEMAEQMLDLATTQPGFLGAESTRDTEGFGITVSYWASKEAILAWKLKVEHLDAQSRGKSEWYENYHIRIAKVERAYEKHNRG